MQNNKKQNKLIMFFLSLTPHSYKIKFKVSFFPCCIQFNLQQFAAVSENPALAEDNPLFLSLAPLQKVILQHLILLASRILAKERSQTIWHPGLHIDCLSWTLLGICYTNSPITFPVTEILLTALICVCVFVCMYTYVWQILICYSE